MTRVGDAQTNERPSWIRKDIDAEIIPVMIGRQVWMKRNLAVSTFSNGDTIQEAKTNKEWKAAFDQHRSVWCYYENDSINGSKYGKLYNWYAVNDPRGLAPRGWHIPSDKEWTILADTLGEEKAGALLKNDSGWDSPIGKSGNGNNASGFSALPGGYRKGGSSMGSFSGVGYSGLWWSSTTQLFRQSGNNLYPAL